MKMLSVLLHSDESSVKRGLIVSDVDMAVKKVKRDGGRFHLKIYVFDLLIFIITSLCCLLLSFHDLLFVTSVLFLCESNHPSGKRRLKENLPQMSRRFPFRRGCNVS